MQQTPLRDSPLPAGRHFQWLSVSALVVSAFIALTQIVGWSFATAWDQGSLRPAWPEAPVFLLVWAVLSAITYALVMLTFRLLDYGRQSVEIRRQRRARLSRGVHRRIATRDPWFFGHVFLCSFVCLCLFWSIWLIIYLPGTLPYDGARSMSQFITDAPLENHHPVVMNLLYAGLMGMGMTFGSQDLGLFFVVIFQYLACAAIFSASIKAMERLGAPHGLIIATLCFFALWPTWGLYAQAAIKDTLFNGLFLLFMLCLAGMVGNPGGRLRDWAGLLVSSVLVCLTRNNGVYVVVPTLLVLCLYVLIRRQRVESRGRRRESTPSARPLVCAAAVTAVTAFAYVITVHVMWPAFGIASDGAKETFSIPFQQTARYATLAPDDMSEGERKAIDAVLPLDQLDDLYSPMLSDPVKESSHDLEGDALGNYLSAWASMGLRHPGIYLEATLANTFGYFYPWMVIGLQPEVGRMIVPTWNSPLDFSVGHVMPEEIVRGTSDFLDDWIKTPVLGAVFSPGLFMLFFFVLLSYVFHMRDYEALLLFVPSLLLFLTVLAGPLNGCLRYVLPIVASLPLLTCYLMRPKPTIAPGRA